MKALTPDSLTQTARSLRLRRSAVPTFRPQPRDPPDGRFEYQSPQRHQLFQSSPSMSRLATRSRRNRFVIPTDCQFTSGCSPPRLTATQLPSISGTATVPGTDLHRADKASSRDALMPAQAGIHEFGRIGPQAVDGRNKPGHDGKRTPMGHSQRPLV